MPTEQMPQETTPRDHIVLRAWTSMQVSNRPGDYLAVRTALLAPVIREPEDVG